jgi:hypothetical protein
MWESYRKTCVPKEAEEPQIRHTRAAFYAGASGILRILMTICYLEILQKEKGQSIETISEEHAERITELMAELQEFIDN